MTSTERTLPSGDEAGTMPGDRKFRPDVQGLRAVAILLVVLFHIGFPGVSGGYVGVDVFFVISGFVITGVLLRERATANSTSLLAFYGRRARRIIPAATLVIIVTVIGAVIFLGSVIAGSTAVDGQWASVFLANFHFAANSTNYLASQKPPSPLQNFWSLAVEEQFYIVYPTVFLVVAGLLTRASLRLRLGIVLGICLVASYALSITMTTSNPSGAFFSPFTRAWELALGGLVALSSDSLRQLQPKVAALLSWAGLGAIVVAALVFTSSTQYPGSLVAVPVLGAALIIGAGTAQPAWGVEALLGRRPFQLLGLVSYSWYLWHWPILTIVAESESRASLPLGSAILWVLFALLLAVLTYFILENPVRHSTWLRSRRWASVSMGACLIASGFAVSTVISEQNPVAASDNGLGNAISGHQCIVMQAEQSALRSTFASTHKVLSSRHPVHQLRMMIVGDSTACSLSRGLQAAGSYYGLRFENGTAVGCGIVSGHLAPYYFYGVNLVAYSKVCQHDADAAEAAALKAGPPNVVLWSSTYERSSIQVTTSSGSRTLVAGTQEWRTVMQARIDARVQQFLNLGAKVILVLQPPFVNIGEPKRPTSSDQQFEAMNQLLIKSASRDPARIGIINLADRVCPTGPPCPNRVDGITVRPDHAHYGKAGTLWVAEWLIPKILSTERTLAS